MSSDPKEVFKRLKRDIDDDIGSFFDALYENVKTNTPVDTGAAKRAWKKRGRVSIRDNKYRQVVIKNDKQYITRLDEGYSKQAPNGIVEKAIEKALRDKNNN